MSHLNTRIECAREYYAEKLKEGRKDPIAKMLLGTLKLEIEQLEARYEKEKNRSMRIEKLPRASKVMQYVRQTMYRLRYYKDRGLSYVSSLVGAQRPQTTEAIK